MKTNLAFVLEPFEPLQTEVLNASALGELLRLGTAKRSKRSPARAARRRRMLVSFQDDSSSLFRPFRIY